MWQNPGHDAWAKCATKSNDAHSVFYTQSNTEGGDDLLAVDWSTQTQVKGFLGLSNIKSVKSKSTSSQLKSTQVKKTRYRNYWLLLVIKLGVLA
jgi:hypothetical protein